MTQGQIHDMNKSNINNNNNNNNNNTNNNNLVSDQIDEILKCRKIL